MFNNQQREPVKLFTKQQNLRLVQTERKQNKMD